MGATSVQADKVVNVRLSESEHSLLKTYCASLNRSMQDVLRDFALMQIQKQHFCCRLVRSLMEEHGIEQDPRVSKHCYGYACYYCSHAEACMAGETDLLYVPRQEIRELVAEESAISSISTAAASRTRPSRVLVLRAPTTSFVVGWSFRCQYSTQGVQAGIT